MTPTWSTATVFYVRGWSIVKPALTFLPEAQTLELE